MKNNKIIIKNAEVNDLESILKIQKQAFIIQAEIYNDFTLPPLHEKLKNIKKDLERNTILKAVYKNKIVGSIRGSEHNDSCHIYRLSVDPNIQNMGIGVLLIRAIENQFPQVKRFDLFTGYKSKKNLYIYKKTGYKKFKEAANYKSKITIIYMEKFNL